MEQLIDLINKKLNYREGGSWLKKQKKKQMRKAKKVGKQVSRNAADAQRGQFGKAAGEFTGKNKKERRQLRKEKRKNRKDKLIGRKGECSHNYLMQQMTFNKTYSKEGFQGNDWTFVDTYVPSCDLAPKPTVCNDTRRIAINSLRNNEADAAAEALALAAAREKAAKDIEAEAARVKAAAEAEMQRKREEKKKQLAKKNNNGRGLFNSGYRDKIYNNTRNTVSKGISSGKRMMSKGISSGKRTVSKGISSGKKTANKKVSAGKKAAKSAARKEWKKKKNKKYFFQGWRDKTEGFINRYIETFKMEKYIKEGLTTCPKPELEYVGKWVSDEDITKYEETILKSISKWRKIYLKIAKNVEKNRNNIDESWTEIDFWEASFKKCFGINSTSETIAEGIGAQLWDYNVGEETDIYDTGYNNTRCSDLDNVYKYIKKEESPESTEDEKIYNISYQKDNNMLTSPQITEDSGKRKGLKDTFEKLEKARAKMGLRTNLSHPISTTECSIELDLMEKYVVLMNLCLRAKRADTILKIRYITDTKDTNDKYTKDLYLKYRKELATFPYKVWINHDYFILNKVTFQDVAGCLKYVSEYSDENLIGPNEGDGTDGNNRPGILCLAANKYSRDPATLDSGGDGAELCEKYINGLDVDNINFDGENAAETILKQALADKGNCPNTISENLVRDSDNIWNPQSLNANIENSAQRMFIIDHVFENELMWYKCVLFILMCKEGFKSYTSQPSQVYAPIWDIDTKYEFIATNGSYVAETIAKDKITSYEDIISILPKIYHKNDLGDPTDRKFQGSLIDLADRYRLTNDALVEKPGELEVDNNGKQEITDVEGNNQTIKRSAWYCPLMSTQDWPWGSPEMVCLLVGGAPPFGVDGKGFKYIVDGSVGAERPAYVPDGSLESWKILLTFMEFAHPQIYNKRIAFEEAIETQLRSSDPAVRNLSGMSRKRKKFEMKNMVADGIAINAAEAESVAIKGTEYAFEILNIISSNKSYTLSSNVYEDGVIIPESSLNIPLTGDTIVVWGEKGGERKPASDIAILQFDYKNLYKNMSNAFESYKVTTTYDDDNNVLNKKNKFIINFMMKEHILNILKALLDKGLEKRESGALGDVLTNLFSLGYTNQDGFTNKEGLKTKEKKDNNEGFTSFREGQTDKGLFSDTFGVSKGNNVLKSLTAKKSELFKVQKKDNWLDFIINGISYVALVMLIGIVGGNLNVLSELPKTGVDSLANRIERLFPSTIHADNKLNIDKSIDPGSGIENWCAACDVTVQGELLLKNWPEKIKDTSNMYMSAILIKFIESIKDLGAFKNFLIPIALLILFYLKAPMFLAFFIALFASVNHPHWMVYWSGLIPLMLINRETIASILGTKPMGNKQASSLKIWTGSLLLAGFISTLGGYVGSFGMAKQDSKTGGAKGSLGKAAEWARAGGPFGKLASDHKEVEGDLQNAASRSEDAAAMNNGIIMYAIHRAWIAAGWTVKKGEEGGSLFFRVLRDVSQSQFAYLISLGVTIIVFLFIGWWLAPLWGLGTTFLYSIYAQLQIMILVLFGTLQPDEKQSKLEHLRKNKFSLTIMAIIMITYSALKSLTPNTSKTVIGSMIGGLVLLLCCQ